MITFINTYLALVAHVTLAAVATGSNSIEGPLRVQCVFTVNQLEFNLCPILNNVSSEFKIFIDEETPPTRTSNSYAISFSGPLEWDTTLPADLQCDERTRICLTVINTRPNHQLEPARILQVIPVAGVDLNPVARLERELEKGETHAPLRVTFHGGRYNNQKQKAAFFFYCDHDVAEPTAPAFMWRFNGTHAFSWRTKHACYKPSSSKPADPERDTDTPQQPPKDPESAPDDNANDLLSQSTATHLFLKLLMILCLAQIVLFSLSRRFRFLIPSIHRCRLHFHRTASLVLWPLDAWREHRFGGVSSLSYADGSGVESAHEGIPLTPMAGEAHKNGTRYGSLEY